jgi:hypothetical protein
MRIHRPIKDHLRGETTQELMSSYNKSYKKRNDTIADTLQRLEQPDPLFGQLNI